MDVHNVEMVMSAVSASQYPTDGKPEIALVVVQMSVNLL